jgi:hypothetical protein
MIYLFFFISIPFLLIIGGEFKNKMKKYHELEREVIEYRKIKRKMNKWRISQQKIIEILDNGLIRLKELRIKRKIKN